MFKILSAIEDLPDGLASALTQDELDVITSFFLSSGEAVTVLEEVLDRPFIREARDDLRSAVDHLLTKPAANCGFSRWSSLQFIEKLLKGYLGSRGTSYGFTHDLTELAELAEQRGLIVDRVALRALQCAAALRYDSQAISMADAMAAHHHSLGLGRQIGHAILGRPGCVQWQVSGISGV